MTTFPSKEELKKMRKILNRGPFTRPLPENATPIEKLKYEICRQFVRAYNKDSVTQKNYAKKLGIDPAIMSKILHYHIDRFTVDRLFTYLEILHPNAKISVKIS